MRLLLSGRRTFCVVIVNFSKEVQIFFVLDILNLLLQLLSSLLPQLVLSSTFCVVFLHDDTFLLICRHTLSHIEFFTFSACFWVPSIQGKVMKNDGAGNRYIKRCCFVCVLRYVHKVITNIDLSLVQATSFITKQKQSITTKRLLLDRTRFRHDFNTADRYLILCTVLSNVSNRSKESHVHLCSRALGAKC